MTINEKIAKFLSGRKPVGKQTLTFDSTAAVSLTLPTPTAPEDRPYFAVMTLEADVAETDLVKTAHFWETGDTPTATDGMTLGHGWQYELQGYNQLANFKIIAVTADRTHRLQVTYYKLGDQ